MPGVIRKFDVATEAAGQSTRIKPRNIPLVVLLSVVTLGIYFPSWFLLRRHGINSLNANEKMTIFPSLAAIVLQVISIAFIVGASFAFYTAAPTTAEMYDRIAEFATWASTILVLVQSFKVRRIFEAHLKQGPQQSSDVPSLEHSQSSLSRVAVFFLTIFYLQYVINRRIAPAA